MLRTGLPTSSLLRNRGLSLSPRAHLAQPEATHVQQAASLLLQPRARRRGGPQSLLPPSPSPTCLTELSFGPGVSLGLRCLSLGSSLSGPTSCSTSRAVYLLIASLTITHNNQLRHCQRNTHSGPGDDSGAGLSCFSIRPVDKREIWEEKTEDGGDS